MLRSLYAAISGMRSQQTKLDVIGNNISNVNTTAFKGSRVKFQDMLSQTIKDASAPMGSKAGTNPSQVGLGMTVAGIDTIHTQGALQATGRTTDLAIQGSGFFVLSDGARSMFTRDGAFSLSLSNELVSASTGFKLQGWMADASGNISTTGVPGGLKIPIGEQVLTQATTRVEFSGNLSNAAQAGDTHRNFITVFDSKGDAHELTVTFTKSAVLNTWSYSVAFPSGFIPPAGMTIQPPANTTLAFDQYGNATPQTNVSQPFTLNVPGAAPVSFRLDLSAISQVAGDSTALMKYQDGNFPGELLTFSIGRSGIITGTYSNGLVKDIGQIALAFFPNPEGLLKNSGNLYTVSSNSGEPRIGVPGTEGRGVIETGMLEMSNVDLASEFTEMISTSRAFQANSRVVSTSDEMLQELIHLKR